MFFMFNIRNFNAAAAPAALVEEVVTKVPAVKKSNVVRKTAPKKKVVQSPAKKVAAVAITEETNNANLDFQHTSALLELANTDKKDSFEGGDANSKPDSSQSINEITGQLLEANKMEETENQMVDGLEDDETDNDNMIIISSSDDVKEANTDEYGTELDEGVLVDDEDAEIADTLVDDEKQANEVISILLLCK